MNLYLFNANDSAAVYGIGTYLKELTSVLEGTAINVHIIHLHSVRPEFEIEKTNTAENWYIPEVRNFHTFSGTIRKMEDYYLNVIYLLRIHIKDTKDLLFHFNYNQSQFLAKELKTVFNCRTVAVVHFNKWALELHGNLSHFQALKSKPENQRNSFEQLLYTTDEYESLLYKEVDRVIALSHYTQNLLCNEYQLNPDKIAVIPNGLSIIDNGKFTIDNEGRINDIVLRRKWRISDREFIILFVGRLHAVKGLLFLIRAFRKVLENVPNCRLIIAGNGNYDTYIKEAVAICTRIAFTGLLDKKELFELYRIADIGVIPSFHEQCSFVAIEMMMYGLPIIGSTSTGLKEMIKDGETGLHIPVIEHDDSTEIDSSLLAEKILYLLQHHKERKLMGANAHKRYKQLYSSELMAKNMLKFYKSLFDDVSKGKKKIVGIKHISTIKPLLSVVMPVYNGMLYLNQAIDSILHQTMNDFELIIIDDASTDDTVLVVNSYNDRRIRVFKNHNNLGNYPSRNLGIKKSTGKYIAVMDADDICMPERFEKQIQFMDINKEIGIVASAVRLSTGGVISRPSDPELLKTLFFQENYLIHPSLMFRRQMLDKHLLRYDEQYRYSADYDLLVRAFRYLQGTCLKDILLTYRIHQDQITSRHRKSQWEFANQIRIKQIQYLNIQPTADEIEIHLSLLRKKQPDKKYTGNDYTHWIEKLIAQNNAVNHFNPSIFTNFLHNLLKELVL